MKVRVFKNLFTARGQDAGWGVVQAATLLATGTETRTTSFVIYAALELRMAIEQLVFTIITIANDNEDADILGECRKKDGLFRVLQQVSPKYTLRCKFQSAAAAVMPGVPPLAEWDIKALLRYYQELSGLCHSQLVIRTFDADPEFWSGRLAFLIDVHTFLADGMRKGTAVMTFTNAKISIRDLWEAYASKKISLEDAVGEMKRRNPTPSMPIKSQRVVKVVTGSRPSRINPTERPRPSKE
jgi:hypothetical protein